MRFKYAVASIALLCLHAPAQSPGNFSFKDLRITGKVVDAGTGEPLDGVVVRVVSISTPQLWPSTTTNADGKYSLALSALISPTVKVEFSKTGWLPDPRELIANLSGRPQTDVLLADSKGNTSYYKTLAEATVKYSASNATTTPPHLEPILSLPPERKAETLRAIQAENPEVYSNVIAAERNYAAVKQLREKFATTPAYVTADLDWTNPGRVLLNGSVRSESDKAKLFEILRQPSGGTVFTDNLKIDRSVPALNHFMANQPQPPMKNLYRPDRSGG